ncbi:MAG TPA: hypothetical protein VKE98_24815 [Gemmataceae bacterium]|nr:hypothetical protein [Gemmataceae bacterium]
MKWRGRLVAWAVLFLLTGARANSQDKKDSKTPNYYPLTVGNEWTFQVTAGGNTAQAVSRIVKMETINEVPLAYLEASVKGKVVATEHLRQTKEGVFRYRNNRQEITPPFCLVKYPVKSGSKWSGDIAIGNDKGKYYSEAIEETVEVKAGKFKAMRVSVKVESPKQGVVTTTYWFVPDIGFVRQTVDTGRLNVVMELEKFQAAKKDEKKDDETSPER